MKLVGLFLFCFSVNFSTAHENDTPFDINTIRHIKLPTHLANGQPFVVRLGTIPWVVNRYFMQINPNTQDVYTQEKLELLQNGISTLQNLLNQNQAIQKDLDLFSHILNQQEDGKGKLGHHPFIYRFSGGMNCPTRFKIPQGIIVKFADNEEDMARLIAAIPGSKGDSLPTSNVPPQRKPFEEAFTHIKKGNLARSVFEKGLEDIVIAIELLNYTPQYYPTLSTRMTPDINRLHLKYGKKRKINLVINFGSNTSCLDHKQLQWMIYELKKKRNWLFSIHSGPIFHGNISLLAQEHVPLTELKIDGCWLGGNNKTRYKITKKFDRLSQVLRDNHLPSFKKLTLNGSTICEYHTVFLFESLRINTSLVELNFTNHEINDKIACHIREMLQANKHIKILNLSDNKITDKQIDTIVGGLKNNKTVEILNLGHNQITDSGTQSLRDALTVNTTLIKLNLKSNSISKNAQKTLYEIAYFKGVEIIL